MSRVLVSNFDFEEQLASPRGSVNAGLRRVCDELSYCWLLGCRAGDIVEGPSTDDLQLRDSCERLGLEWPRFESDVELHGHEIVPWGWSDQVAQRIKSASDSATESRDRTQLEVVGRVNSRDFSIDLERQLANGVGAESVSTLDDLLAAIRSFGTFGGCMLRENWSCSARGMRHVRGPSPDSADVNWARKRMERDGLIIVEPFLQVTDENSVHFELTPENPRFIGTVSQITDRSGAYRGGVVSSAMSDHEAGLPPSETTRAAASRIHELGYRGPLGIDSVTYVDSGQVERTRELQDLNARWSMGRLLLECRRRLALADQMMAWVHVRWSTESDPAGQWDRLIDRVARSVKVVRLSPFSLRHQPTRMGSVLVIAEDSQTLQATIDVLL